MADYTPEQIEQMREAVQVADRLAAEQKAAEEAAFLLQLRQFTNSPSYQNLMSGIAAIRVKYRDDDRFAPFIENLVIGLPSLAERAGPLPAPAPEAPTDGE